MKKTLLLGLILAISCQSRQNEQSAQTLQQDTSATTPTSNNDPVLSKIKLPEGFKIEYYAQNIKNARSMALGAKGTLFIGTRKEGKVYALVDQNKDNKIDKVYTLASGLNMPNGVAFRNGALYLSEVSKVWRYDDIENNLANPPTPVLVRSDFPTDEHHGWKYIAFGPDGKLYVPVGAPCNICEEQDERFSSITRMDADGKNFEVYAHGIRNTVGFDWHPETKNLWFTENGRDMMGDDIPADELNVAPQKGLHFGYPYCHAGDVSDPEFGKKRSCDEFKKPIQKLYPHTAALGMKFYNGPMFPAQYKNQVFIAEHGSWNRSRKIGYRVSMVTLENGKATKYASFAEGWLQPNDQVLGRPVDILILPDGSMLVSDDKADCIYRISTK